MAEGSDREISVDDSISVEPLDADKVQRIQTFLGLAGLQGAPSLSDAGIFYVRPHDGISLGSSRVESALQHLKTQYHQLRFELLSE
ncbi:MAG: hypothetical protein ACD_28C00129G0004 [uncultured bacterium]|nr:MAG: hypothetical protein ACD_28C00129G0004 [uncultured bacterium]KKT76150.1 MAG: hypothetical protein UW70_C0021G0017 [Candidatus Peregrinibacteria bacterium GW2011_GWA2_44_7]